MSQKRDYYEVLGVAKDADERTLKKAYHKLAHQYHPDKNPGDKIAEEKFKEASEAYAVLSDSEKKAQYDRFGHNGPVDFGAGFNNVNIQDIFGDIFGDLFGGGGRRRGGPQRGSDLRYPLEVAFEEAAFGVEKSITFTRLQDCQTCLGSGAKAGTKPQTCQACGGRGEVRMQQGFFAIARPCGNCQGTGQKIDTPCTACKGRAQTDVEKSLNVKIPPGVNEGTRMRFVNEGEQGRGGGPFGDLYVVISIKQHPLFARDEDDVLCEVPLSFPQAALGCSLDVPTLDGKVAMKIPAGTQPGAIFRLKGKGIPHLRSNQRGDQLVKVRLEVPKNLNTEQETLLRQFAESTGAETHPESKGFFNKVRELFD